MTTKRELPDGTTITYTSAGRLWKRPKGDLLSVNYGPWEPIFPDQTYPGLPCDRQEGLW